MSTDLVRAATRWRSNAHLVEDLVRLGYLHSDWDVLDPTFGSGNWWKRWRPENLTTHVRSEDGSDFRALPYRDGAFDCAAYDPPYVAIGGRETSTIKKMHGAYGMADPEFRTPAELQEIIDAGLTEMARVVRPSGRNGTGGGYILCKCKDYITGGKLWDGTGRTVSHALSLGLDYVDRLEHLGNPGPQSQTRQVHARRNLSTLLVFRVTKAAVVARRGGPIPSPSLTEGATT